MDGVLTLRGIIMSRYKSIGEFADAIKWSRSKASRIVNGIQSPDVIDIESLATVLELNSADLIMRIFFPRLSTNCTSN